MKVYYNGFNLHRQFPTTENLIETFIDHSYNDLQQIEVNYHFVVLLVADVIVIKGAKNETVPIQGRVKQISCNEDKILALLESGDLLKITDSVMRVPRMMNLDEDDSIFGIACGSKFIVALTKKGFVYNIPNKLKFQGKNMVKIKAGREHCLLLDEQGNVFSFGRGSRGQLGHGCLEDESEPRFVEALGGIKIGAIEAGGWHSCALSIEGDLYVWGWNGNGQLGLSASEDTDGDLPAVMATPQVVDFDLNITKVSCGCRHTVILTDEGKLYGCGWNKYRQLKKDKRDNVYKMSFLGDFSGDVVKDLKCGPWNTLVLCEDEKEDARKK